MDPQFKKKIFEYDDYRKFLVDFYIESKTRNKNFSFRFFARVAGFGSPSFLKLVMDGKRNISAASARKFSSAMKLTQEETQFFVDLVGFNQAVTREERQFHAANLMKSKTYRSIHPLREAEFRYFTKWFYVAIRELVGLGGFKEDPEWIAKRVYPNITESEAREALEELLKLGLLSRGENGKLIQSNFYLATPDEVLSAYVADYHRNTIGMAIKAIDRFPREKREISALVFGVSEKTAKIIKEKLQSYRNEIGEIVSLDTGQEKVYQLNFQLFPLSGLTEEEIL